MNSLLLIFVVIGFLAIVLLIEGGYLLWNSQRGAAAQRIQRRLQVLSGGGALSIDSQLVRTRLMSKTPAVAQMLLRIPRIHLLDRWLLQSGLQQTVAAFLVMTAIAGVAGLILALFLRAPLWLIPACVLAAAAVPALRVLRARRTRLRVIEQQLPEALELMSRAMRAGHAFPSAVQMVGAEGPEPIAQEFRNTFEEINFGIQTQDALKNLAARVPITDLAFFSIAVAIQRETGGNLAELLDNLAALTRARFRLLGTIRVLSTEGRVSGWILSILPFALLAVINFINPKFMRILWTDPAGIVTVQLGAVLLVFGIVWMWRIVKIRV